MRWLEPHVVNKLHHLRGAGEHSDVTLRLAGEAKPHVNQASFSSALLT
jgi:hypothetical protein